MENSKIHWEWYGQKAKLVVRQEDCTVIEYGCEGTGIVTSYLLFEGVWLCFLEFDTPENIVAKHFQPDILEISYCKEGRFECEFSNHTVAYLPEGSFSVNSTKYLPVSFSFPLRRCSALSLVLEKDKLSSGMCSLMEMVPVSLERIGENLKLESSWYVDRAAPKLQQLFLDFYTARGLESLGYFKIKVLELLYHVGQLTRNNDCDFRYFNVRQIQLTKEICAYLTEHFDEKISLEQAVKARHMNLSVFHKVFMQIYGDTPYSYLKKYKMNLAAKALTENEMKIGDLAVKLGYSNASKFAKAFQSVYGVLPKDFRKNRQKIRAEAPAACLRPGELS